MLATPETPCDYLEGQTSVTHFIHPETPMDVVLYSTLIDAGYRRSGRLVYHHACPDCRKCQSLRVDPQAFNPTRSQRRCLKRNEDLSVIPRQAEFREEYFELYSRYINSRHGDGNMVDPSPETFCDFLMTDWCPTWFVEMRHQGRLLGVAVVDHLPKGLSAVYTFFDPDETKRGLGNFAVLWQLKLAKKRRLAHVYLGYWIEGSKKMDYKAGFGPAEVFRDGRWQALVDPDA